MTSPYPALLHYLWLQLVRDAAPAPEDKGRTSAELSDSLSSSLSAFSIAIVVWVAWTKAAVGEAETAEPGCEPMET